MRLQLGLTQVQVCKALGRPTSWLSKCELGERRLDPIDLQELAAVYGASVSDLLPPVRGLGVIH
jgi:transcriptional regulator with XRE-family HTH domain